MGEDKQHQDKVAAKNSLESYAYSMKSTMDDEKVKDKIDEADRTAILDKIKEITDWLDDNTSAEKDEFEDKKKELEGVCNPIMQKFYSDAGTPGGMPGRMPGGFPGAGGAAPDMGGESSGPKVE